MAGDDSTTVVAEESGAKAARDFFRDNVADYDEAHYTEGFRSFMSVRQQCVLEEVDKVVLQDPTAAADFGCGPGQLLAELARRNVDAVGMDTSAGMLGLSEEKIKALGRNPRLALGDIRHLPVPDESLELVCSNGVIEYLADWQVAVQEFARVLKPGGTLILPTTNALSPIGWPDFVTERIKRTPLIKPINAFLVKTGKRPVRARTFKGDKHTPGEFREAIRGAGLEVLKIRYFYFLPWPHPFDRVFPKLNAALNRSFEWVAGSPIGVLSEGFVAVARKP